MFGQVPRLPVDFLLSGVDEPIDGWVAEWVARHQRVLKETYSRVQDRLAKAAESRKEKYDQSVHDDALSEGCLVYLRDHAFRGRHKIQNHWSSTLYRVVRAPTGDGGVYTIASLQMPTCVKHVHRSQLKCAPDLAMQQGLVDQGLGESGLEVNPDYSLPPIVITHTGRAPMDRPLGISGTASVLPSSGPVSVEVPDARRAGYEGPSTLTSPSILTELSTGDLDCRSDEVLVPPLPQQTDRLRRTTRITAGQHSNPHHLPRTVNSVHHVNSPSSINGQLFPSPEQVSGGPFRPWL